MGQIEMYIPLPKMCLQFSHQVALFFQSLSEVIKNGRSAHTQYLNKWEQGSYVQIYIVSVCFLLSSVCAARWVRRPSKYHLSIGHVLTNCLSLKARQLKWVIQCITSIYFSEKHFNQCERKQLNAFNEIKYS